MIMRRQKDDSTGPIDFVITWVDGSDPAWLEEKSKYQPESDITTDASIRRYRDWGTLKYLFRGVESYAPWVRKVFFITWGHVPNWLDLSAPKLEVVKHEDYIPREYLPTFSSHPIELNMHRIEGLSEHFVYFNDDMYITQPIAPTLFFRNGLPVLPPQLHGILPRGDTGVMAHVYVNNISAINRHLDYRKTLSADALNWFDPFRVGFKTALENAYCASYAQLPGIRHLHLPTPMRKSTIEEIWKAEPNTMKRTSRHRFRSSEDVSPYLFWQWELAAGSFVPCKANSLGRRFSDDLGSVSQVIDAISKRRFPLICVNDMGRSDGAGFVQVARSVSGAFQDMFPAKSRFEL